MRIFQFRKRSKSFKTQLFAAARHHGLSHPSGLNRNNGLSHPSGNNRHHGLNRPSGNTHQGGHTHHGLSRHPNKDPELLLVPNRG